MAYECIYQEINDLLAQYHDTVPSLYRGARERVAAWQYARGGVTLQRGYYCPSPVYDLVVGGANRGRLLKSPARCKTPPDFAYGFDAQGRLIVVDGPYSDLTHSPYFREAILREENREIGLRMDTDDRLCGISICRYQDGRLTEYITALRLDRRSGFFTSFEQEVYTYQDGHLSTMDLLEHDAPSGLVRTWHYEFDHNGDSPFPRK